MGTMPVDSREAVRITTTILSQNARVGIVTFETPSHVNADVSGAGTRERQETGETTPSIPLERPSPCAFMIGQKWSDVVRDETGKIASARHFFRENSFAQRRLASPREGAAVRIDCR